jgi:TetR/AcrR family transcriptional regulator
MPRAKGERSLEILKALAQMLEAPKWERITTAALAAKLDVSEAALYRHFASKAQMYEGLIEFIESSVFTVANKITEDEADGHRQCEKLVEMLLAFAEKNPGMVRVMTGDALVGEHERLQVRMNQFFERFESTLKQSLRVASDGDAPAAPARYCATCSAACISNAKSGFAKRARRKLLGAETFLLTCRSVIVGRREDSALYGAGWADYACELIRGSGCHGGAGAARFLLPRGALRRAGGRLRAAPRNGPGRIRRLEPSSPDGLRRGRGRASSSIRCSRKTKSGSASLADRFFCRRISAPGGKPSTEWTPLFRSRPSKLDSIVTTPCGRSIHSPHPRALMTVSEFTRQELGARAGTTCKGCDRCAPLGLRRVLAAQGGSCGAVPLSSYMWGAPGRTRTQTASRRYRLLGEKVIHRR